MEELLPKLTIISAREQFEWLFPDNVAQWKLHSLIRVKDNLDPNIIINFIAVSDSKADLTAAENLAAYN